MYFAQLKPLERAQLHASLAFAANSLFVMFLKTQGVDPEARRTHLLFSKNLRPPREQLALLCLRHNVSPSALALLVCHINHPLRPSRSTL